MANKKIKKVPLDKNCLIESLQINGSSIRKLGADYNFGWSSKSIERGIKDGEVSPELLDALGQSQRNSHILKSNKNQCTKVNFYMRNTLNLFSLSMIFL